MEILKAKNALATTMVGIFVFVSFVYGTQYSNSVFKSFSQFELFISYCAGFAATFIFIGMMLKDVESLASNIIPIVCSIFLYHMFHINNTVFNNIFMREINMIITIASAFTIGLILSKVVIIASHALERQVQKEIDTHI